MTLPTGPKRKARKPNPNDTTFRNMNALKARVANLEKQVKSLVRQVAYLLEHNVDRIFGKKMK